jgi:hypothetical protein
MLCEKVTNLALGRRERKVAHVDLGHSNILRNKKHKTTGLEKADSPEAQCPSQGERTGDPCHLIVDVSA